MAFFIIIIFKVIFVMNAFLVLVISVGLNHSEERKIPLRDISECSASIVGAKMAAERHEKDHPESAIKIQKIYCVIE